MQISVGAFSFQPVRLGLAVQEQKNANSGFPDLSAASNFIFHGHFTASVGNIGAVVIGRTVVM